MTAHHIATIVGGDPPGGVVGLSLSFTIGYHYSVVLVGADAVAGVERLLEDGELYLKVLDFHLEVLHGCLQCQFVRLFCEDAVGVHRHLFCKGAICRCQVGDGNTILHRGMCQIGKGHGYFHGVVSGYCAVTPLAGDLLSFAQVNLRFDEVCLELIRGLFRILLDAPGTVVFSELPRLRNKAVGNSDELSLCDGLSHRSCTINTLV